jgi:hypothetical protein
LVRRSAPRRTRTILTTTRMGTIPRRRRPTRTRPLRVTIRRRRIISRGAVGTCIHNATTPARPNGLAGRRGRPRKLVLPSSPRRVPRGPTDCPTRQSGLASPRRDNRTPHSQEPRPSRSALAPRSNHPRRLRTLMRSPRLTASTCCISALRTCRPRWVSPGNTLGLFLRAIKKERGVRPALIASTRSL